MREIAVTGPLHASRRVRSVQVNEVYTEIRMEPCNVQLGAVADMGVVEAIKHLRAMVTTEQAPVTEDV